ncbi:methionine ABC transporter ATP-binding protein [Undibacterium squillarum]|uniref:Methionine import ATP-binding protein MetN 2 n=1 Tax=Undibacterium squillarum TaxID=1131567 RepID=A0ABQ2XTM7_9BURK|nr:methionine ABC transporter ATP-binding protein [Undibacterium squillarum]GGX32079.1 methionine import ATP-binding protein MetN 2 [Undibacterium squillarum]
MIEISGLHKSYTVAGKQVPALNNIQLSIPTGSVFGIIGRSGAGKSTLLRTLNLLERPDQGRILIDGEDITFYEHRKLLALRQRIGMVFQHFNLLSSKTIAENIAFPLRLAGQMNAQQRAERVQELLALVGLTEHADKYPAQLSGGQKQRVGIARALANAPRLLLCDEATSALDPETTQSILQLLLDINRQLGLTIVLITHEMQVIRTICDQVAVIERGDIVEQGEVAEVFLHPQHPVTRAMVAEQHELDLSWLSGLRHPDYRLWRLTYLGDSTHAPVLSRVGAETGVEISILQGVISRIKNTPYGQLVIGLRADEDTAIRVLKQLSAEDVRVDVITQQHLQQEAA